MNSLRMFIDGLVRRPRVESDMAQELKFHVESRAADLERTGLSPGQALRQAQLEFGGVEGYKERCREANGYRLFDELQADLRYAFRTLRKNFGFTFIAVLSLALGIGANLSCFASLYSIILHPFAYPNLDRIMMVSEARATTPSDRDPVATADYLDWKRSSRLFESLAAYRRWDVNLTGVDRPDHIQAAQASAEFFQVLGIQPILGRTFSTAECEPGRDAIAVVSHAFWQTRMASTPDAIGQTVSLGGRKYTVIGVMPDEFNLPLASELWSPLVFTPEERKQRGIQPLLVLGKLRPDVMPAQAGAEMDGIAVRLEERYPQTNEERRALVTPLQEVMKTPGNHFVLVLMGGALFVLLLACANVGSLQVARAMGRQKEIGLRSALGASQFRIVRQLLTECLVLGLAGGAVGLALASWNLGVMRAGIPAMVYRIVAGLKEMQINGEAVVLCVALSLGASLLCCIPAAIQILRQGTAVDLNEVLKEGARSSDASPSRSRLRMTLVIGEVALAFILLVGAGLMVGTFKRLLTVNLGYDSKNVLTAQVALSGNEYQKPSRMAGFYDNVLGDAGRLPDVVAAAASADMGRSQSISIEGRNPARSGEPRPEIHPVSAQYLKAIKIPLLQGRWISEQDGPDSQRIVVLTESVARHYWPDSNPIGQRVRLGNGESPWLTVAGVVRDINDWFFGNPMPAAYVSYRQFPQASMELLIRTAHDPGRLAGSLRQLVEAIDRDQPVYNVHTLEDQLQENASGVRSSARMMGIYAVIALLLAVIGIYSISSFFVAQRTREIGVRMSLGATRQSILMMVLSQSFVMAGLGLLIGVPIAILLTIGMSHVLYNVVTIQPTIFVALTVVLGSASALAGYIPAHRAARVDPMIALRHE